MESFYKKCKWGLATNYFFNYEQIRSFDYMSFAEGWSGSKHLIYNLLHIANLSLITFEKQDLQ